MTEKYRFFDSIDGEDERYYTADEFAEYFRQLISSGIFNGGTNLQVTCGGTDMSVQINEGYAWLEGYLYKIDTEPLELALVAADPVLDRIDRVVIRLDKRLEHRYVKAFILKGESAEEPEAPELTRDENIYEIALAQIKVIAGKSFIGETEITDERFDAKVCGIVNSLIKVDTSQLIGKWEQWLNGIKDETFIPKANFKDGFIKTKEDLVHAIPDRKIQVEKSWPSDPNNMDFYNSRIDENGNLCIDFFYTHGNLFNNGIISEEATNQSPNLYGSRRVGVPFTVERETNRLSVTMALYRESISRLNTLIYEAGSDGYPDLDKQVGRYAPSSYEGPSTLSEYSWEVPLSQNLIPGKQYFIVIYGRDSSYYHTVGYKNTPGESSYYYTTDGGTTWTIYEYTPLLRLNGLVDEGNVVISRPALSNFKNHLSLGIDILDSDSSFYEIDILDMDDNVIKQGVQVGEQLLDIDPELYKDIKVRLKLIRVGLEEPKLTNYQYTWVEHIASISAIQTIIPSDNVLISYPEQRITSSSISICSAKLTYGGRYRVNCELRRTGSAYTISVNIYKDKISAENVVGIITLNSDVYTPVSVDLDAIPPNTNLIFRLSSSNSNANAWVKNLTICGEIGRVANELTIL